MPNRRLTERATPSSMCEPFNAIGGVMVMTLPSFRIVISYIGHMLMCLVLPRPMVFVIGNLVTFILEGSSIRDCDYLLERVIESM